MAELTDRFGTMVFSEEVMKDYLPKDIWKRLAATLEGGEPLDLDVANAVAHAMKVWALPSRPVSTPLGIPLAPPLSRTTSCASPRLSAPTRARPWTRRPRCCAP